MTAEPHRRMRGPGRADHLRNRARILAAARQLFADSSIDEVQLEDVAAAAGVGRATLFRHIGGKDALIAEVYRGRMEDLRGLAVRCMDIDDPREGIEHLLRVVAEWLHEDRGLYDYTTRLVRQGAEVPGEDIRALLGELDGVFVRAKVAGVIDGGVEARDILALMAFTAQASTARQGWFVEVVLCGLGVVA